MRLRWQRRKSLGDKGLVTGNPVRAEIAHDAPPEQRFAGRSGPLHLLVVGGSLGAQVLNESVPPALALVHPICEREWFIRAAPNTSSAVQALYREAGVDAEVVAFIDDMPDRYAKATWSSVAPARSP